ncbi:hypothetical protein BH23ACT5_BH23ACT5_01620 [soil metagenome]
MRVSGHGVSVDLPSGWEGTIRGEPPVGVQGAAGGEWPTVAHLANFPLPAERADFGGDVVESMRVGDVFVVLFEYDSSSAETALFAHEGVPRVAAADFHRDALQHGVPGQSGLQRFFRVGRRAFCLYVVVGSHLDRADVVPQVIAVLDTLELG